MQNVRKSCIVIALSLIPSWDVENLKSEEELSQNLDQEKEYLRRRVARELLYTPKRMYILKCVLDLG
jgi:hypothetical protein